MRVPLFLREGEPLIVPWIPQQGVTAETPVITKHHKRGKSSLGRTRDEVNMTGEGGSAPLPAGRRVLAVGKGYVPSGMDAPRIEPTQGEGNPT